MPSPEPLAVRTTRPAAPPDMTYPAASGYARFIPAPDLEAWARSSFIEGTAPTVNDDHEHLQLAHIGALWTDEANRRQMRSVLATAELGIPQSINNRWLKARAIYQLREWFGEVPDFILTIYAPEWHTLSDVQACALVEHELYHMAQREDEYGCPKFHRDGRPVFGIRGHDLEEFSGVVERYGAAMPDVRRFLDAAQRGPTISPGEIAAACGTCLKRVA